MTSFIRITGPGVKTPRLVFISDAHGRIILANCHTRHIDGQMEFSPAPSCGVLSIYYPGCLGNIRRLLREDEKQNDRIFDEAMQALEQINVGQDYLIRAHPPAVSP